MSKWKIVLFLFLVGLVFLTACQPEDEDTGLGPEDPNVSKIGFPYPYIDISNYSGEVSPDDLMVATSVPPYYTIVDGYLNNCLGQDYIVLQVRNWSGWAFRWGTFGASNGAQSWYVYPKDYSPFHSDGNECPLSYGKGELGVGDDRFLYLPVEHTSGQNTYEIWVNLCTYVGNPPSSDENCVVQHYVFTLAEILYKYIHLEVIKEWLCWQGPGPKYPDTGAIFPGQVVQLLALADVEGMVVILHPRYRTMCWTDDHALEIKNLIILEGLGEEPSPALPPDCPPGFKYDYDLGECVKKDVDCRSITNEKKCNNTPGCWWDPGVSECY